jgi:hypothetical protein
MGVAHLQLMNMGKPVHDIIKTQHNLGMFIITLEWSGSKSDVEGSY